MTADLEVVYRLSETCRARVRKIARVGADEWAEQKVSRAQIEAKYIYAGRPRNDLVESASLAPRRVLSSW